MAHILLIEDDDLLRDTLRQMLELDRHRVTEAAGGAQGSVLYNSAANTPGWLGVGTARQAWLEQAGLG